MAKDGRITPSFEIGGAGHEGGHLYAFEDAIGIIWFYAADGRTSRYQDGKMNPRSTPGFQRVEGCAPRETHWSQAQSVVLEHAKWPGRKNGEE